VKFVIFTKESNKLNETSILCEISKDNKFTVFKKNKFLIIFGFIQNNKTLILN